jgi:heptosyltransferase II
MDMGAHCALVGSGGDAQTTAWVRSALAADAARHVTDLAGATTLTTLAGVLSLARACVSNDSGAMHLAGAVGVPLAALFGPTREMETAPLARSGRRAEVLLHPVWCRPCMLRECPIDHRCMRGLDPDRVFAVVRGLAGAR